MLRDITRWAGECLSSRHSSALSRDIVPTSGGRGRGCRSRGSWSRRSGSKVGRRARWPATTGSPRGGSTSSVGASMPEGKPGSSRDLGDPAGAPSGPRRCWKERSSRSGRGSRISGWTRARRRSGSTSSVDIRTSSCPRSRRSGGSCPVGASSPRSRTGPDEPTEVQDRSPLLLGRILNLDMESTAGGAVKLLAGPRQGRVNVAKPIGNDG